ncbi:MAG: M20/M25/M40 family metallo-hydrolase, partial [Gaiellaceae bacterium]
MTILERLEQLYAIGGGPGANRLHGSAAEDEAHELAAGWMREAGLTVEVDGAGNLFGRAAERRVVWVGSHLDTVPRGGRFDGALGVVAAIEAVASTGRGSVVVFRGEEVGCVGSRALCGSGAELPSAFLELHVEQGPV